MYLCNFAWNIMWSDNRTMYTRTVLSYVYISVLWFLGIFYKSPSASKFSWKDRSSHQGKKEVACIVSKPSSFLFVGMWRVCESSKIKHPRGSGGEGLCPLDERETQACYPFCWIFLLLSNGAQTVGGEVFSKTTFHISYSDMCDHIRPLSHCTCTFILWLAQTKNRGLVLFLYMHNLNCFVIFVWFLFSILKGAHFGRITHCREYI